MSLTIALFGEAEKGQYHTPLQCHTLDHLVEKLGHPPSDSQGLSFAVQALLYERELLYFRVKEEGFSYQDYLIGLKYLQSKDRISNLDALCLPGVGDQMILQAAEPICKIHNSLLLTTEKDLYDYLTSLNG